MVIMSITGTTENHIPASQAENIFSPQCFKSNTLLMHFKVNCFLCPIKGSEMSFT